MKGLVAWQKGFDVCFMMIAFQKMPGASPLISWPVFVFVWLCPRAFVPGL